MKTKTSFLLTLAWFFLHGNPSSKGAVVITELMSFSSHGGGSNNADWFELTNTGPGTVSLIGWSWDRLSNTAGTATFGNVTSMAGGTSLIFTLETLGAESSWISNWGLAGVTVVNLGNGVPSFLSSGDRLYIYDETNAPVTSVNFGAATQGKTFEWDKLGNSLGLSVAGENGAYSAISNGQTSSPSPGVDIGSPGFAVPEPSRMLFLAMSTLATITRRRRERSFESCFSANRPVKLGS
jgi:hypothetical protein